MKTSSGQHIAIPSDVEDSGGVSGLAGRVRVNSVISRLSRQGMTCKQARMEVSGVKPKGVSTTNVRWVRAVADNRKSKMAMKAMHFTERRRR